MLYVIGWLVVVTPVLVLPALWTIFTRAGFHPGLSVLLLFPVLNVIVCYYFAYSKWSARAFESELEANEPR